MKQTVTVLTCIFFKESRIFLLIVTSLKHQTFGGSKLNGLDVNHDQLVITCIIHEGKSTYEC